MIPHEGRFQLSNKVIVNVAGCSSEVRAIADSMIVRIKQTAGISMKISEQEHTEIPDIRFVMVSDMPIEAYALVVTPNEITINASQPNGFFYAVQTIYQIGRAHV